MRKKFFHAVIFYLIILQIQFFNESTLLEDFEQEVNAKMCKFVVR